MDKPALGAGADPDGRAVFGVNNGIRLHMLADGKGEQQVADFLVRRFAL